MEHLVLSFSHTWLIFYALLREIVWETALVITTSVTRMIGKIAHKGYRGIAGIALAPDYFHLTSLAQRQGLLSNLSLYSEAYRYLNSLPLQSGRQTAQKWTVLLDWISLAELHLNGWSSGRKCVFDLGGKKNHGKPTKDLCTAPQCSYEVGHLNWD